MELIKIEGSIHTNTVTNRKYMIEFVNTLTMEGLLIVLEELQMCSDRIKGFVQIGAEEYVVNCVGMQRVIKRRIEDSVDADCIKSQVVVLASGNLEITKVIKKLSRECEHVLTIS